MSPDPGRESLHWAIGTFACWLAGKATEAEVNAAVAAVPPDQIGDYAEITAEARRRLDEGLRARFEKSS